MTDDEIKELRRQQQQRALNFQLKINQELKKEFSSKEDEESEESEEEEEEVKTKKIKHVKFADSQQLDSDDDEDEDTSTSSDEDDDDDDEYDFCSHSSTIKQDILNYKSCEMVEEGSLKSLESLESLNIKGEPIIIEITHTKSDQLDEIDRNLKITRRSNDSLITTPSDIYQQFYKPKSILKVTNDHSQTSKVESKKEKTTTTTTNENKFDRTKAFSGEIIENIIETKTDDTFKLTTTTNQTVAPPRISKFKMSKMK
jgi:hypothetical protein